jgi:hypothetical protein
MVPDEARGPGGAPEVVELLPVRPQGYLVGQQHAVFYPQQPDNYNSLDLSADSCYKDIEVMQMMFFVPSLWYLPGWEAT